MSDREPEEVEWGTGVWFPLPLRDDSVTLYTCPICGACVVEKVLYPKVNARGLHVEWHAEQAAGIRGTAP